MAGAIYARGGGDDDGWPESLSGRRTGTVGENVCVWMSDEHLVEQRQAGQSVTD